MGDILRFYHLIKRGPGAYLGLVQRQAAGDVSSPPHAHWSIEGYTPLTPGTKIRLGNEWVEARALETLVVPPGQVHQIAHGGPVMSFTFLEIMGNPAPVIVTDENVHLLDEMGAFPKEVWMEQARIQGIIE